MLTHTAVLSTCRPHGRPSDSGPLASRVQPKSELGSSRVDPLCLCAFIYTASIVYVYLCRTRHLRCLRMLPLFLVCPHPGVAMQGRKTYSNPYLKLRF